MDKVKRLSLRPALIFFVLASFLLAACGTQVANSNWPGMSADEQGIVYVAYGPGVAAIDTESNQQLWFYPPEGGSANLQFYAAPSVVDGQVVFGDYGASGGMLNPSVTASVYSLDVADGNLQSNWPVSQYAPDETIADKIIAPALQVGDRIFVGTADNLVFALDANSGQPAWPEPFDGAQHSIWGRPTYKDGVVYVSSLDRHVYALDSESGSLLWETDVGGSVSDRSVNNSDLIYAGSFDQQVYALDADDGEVRWTAPAEASVWGAPLFVDGMVYFADLGGNVYAVNAETGEPIWHSSGAGYVVAAPVYADGIVYIASGGDQEVSPDERSGWLIAYDAQTGAELQRVLTRPLHTTPVIVDDTIVVAQQDPQALLVYFSLGELAQTGTYAPPTESG